MNIMALRKKNLIENLSQISERWVVVPGTLF